MVVAALDGAATTAVVDQRVHRFLQHALFVSDDDVRCLEADQVLQPVIPVDDTAVQVIQVTGCEAATVQLNHRVQFRR